MNTSLSVCGDHQHPEKKSDVPAPTGGGTDPTPDGRVHHGDKLCGLGCMEDNDC